MTGVDWNGKRVIAAGIAVRWRRGRKKEVNHWGIVTVFIVVDLGKLPNLNPLWLEKFYGLNRLSRGCLLEVNLEISLVHVLKICRVVRSVFIEFLGLLSRSIIFATVDKVLADSNTFLLTPKLDS